MEIRYTQKADEAFQDMLNAAAREKGNIGQEVKSFVKSNLSKDEWFDFCQAMNAVCMDEEVDPFEPKQ